MATITSSSCEKGSFLVWEDLSVVLPNFGQGHTRRLLQGINGYAKPGRIMAIMGPSGSGKSTLLDALAGRLSRNVVMMGSVLLNGKKRRPGCSTIAYVTQEDVMLGTLTVRETIKYSALLRFPDTMTEDEVNSVVEGTITELGLQECADRVIGSWQRRGISGGEKKRLSIALEILTNPSLLFLDEPTSGLDSASAFFVVLTLRNIACNGRTVISSIHQPSSEVFTLFDDLCLLSGGEMVYHGEAKRAVEFFAEAGFPCPNRRNPSDHFLQCINSDFDVMTAMGKEYQRTQDSPTSSDPRGNMATAEIRATLIETYRRSNYPKTVKAIIHDISKTEGANGEQRSGSQASWQKQLLTLSKRSLVNMSRDFAYFWLRIIVYVIVSICVGSIFYDVGYTHSAIFARGACDAFVVGFMTFMAIGGFPSFLEEMKVFYKEQGSGYYGVVVYILSNFLSSIPFLVAIATLTGSIIYNMVKFRPGFSHLLYYCVNIYACISVVESLLILIISLVPNFLMGFITGAGVIGILLMTSGFFRPLSDLPKPLWRYPISYLNYCSWALQGSYKNNMIGLEFDPLVPGSPKLKGEDVVRTRLGIPLDHSKYWDLAAIFMILMSCRIMFVVTIKVKERASPLLQRLYARRSLRRLVKRPSFRRMPSVTSKRHQPLHSLSSQEGLNSPLH
ncbi:hypothetical protein MLD38_040281 [Melastoma candidum]|uniref:Uncharacterized protein n=1 Tax=Melastoma candidum TaxID=119954 RepID=A0ACB9L5X8_9MYRT|nr:hypothetical protein MLD38_040281 [Melastoma candidum]